MKSVGQRRVKSGCGNQDKFICGLCKWRYHSP